VSGQIYFAVLTFQTIMLGLFLIKGGTIQTILTLPLPILTISLWRSSDVLFRPPQQRLSLEAAADLDQRDEVTYHLPQIIVHLTCLREHLRQVSGALDNHSNCDLLMSTQSSRSMLKRTTAHKLRCISEPCDAISCMPCHRYTKKLVPCHRKEVLMSAR